MVDVGGYYNGQIDKWFARIEERLAGSGEKALVRKSTSGMGVQRGCLAGCLVWLVAAACLGTIATALDHALFAQTSGLLLDPLNALASLVALLLGLTVFLYFAYPESRMARQIRDRLHISPDKGNH